MICHTCTRAHRTHQLATLMIEAAFITIGYSNGKDATRKKAGFSQHERPSVSPGSCRERERHRPSRHDQECRRGIPLRGDGDGNNSNLTKSFHLRTEDNPALSTWLVKRTNKHTSMQMQNEMMKVMALDVLRDVAASLHSSAFYSIMANETTYSSNLEQVVMCFRWVDNSLNAHEEFIGRQQVDRIDAARNTFNN